MVMMAILYKNLTQKISWVVGFLLSFLLFFSLQNAFATIYAPGETLNPNCPMGSINCGVDLFASSSPFLSTTSASVLYVPYTGATNNVDLGTNSLLGDNVLTLQSPNGLKFLGNGTDTVQMNLDKNQIYFYFYNNASHDNGQSVINNDEVYQSF